MVRERVRVRFARLGVACFLSHLDMMRLFERALRRADLPLRMTQGFNPHPRISLPLPLAVGWEARAEVLEFELSDWVRASAIRDALARQLPAGLAMGGLSLVRSGNKAQVTAAGFRVTPVEPVEVGEGRLSRESVKRFLDRSEYMVERLRKGKRKEVNIRPFVRELRLKDGELVMRMAVSPAGTAKPEEVLAGLGFSAEEAATAFRIVRTSVDLRGEGA